MIGVVTQPQVCLVKMVSFVSMLAHHYGAYNVKGYLSLYKLD